ncbi:hypothetical protein ACFFMN_23430 [Planobispora siamensis]|nr:hypothetical protein [Planobispora siamensis]
MTTTPQPRSRGGRRGKLTPETHKRIIDAVRAGATYEGAAGAAGIPEGTLYRWLREAEQPGAPAWKRQFRQDITRARDEVEVRVAAGSVMKAALGGFELERTTIHRPDGTVEEKVRYAPPDGRVGLEILGRRFRDRGWARERVEVTGADGGPIHIQHATIAELAERLHAELTGGDDGDVVEVEVVVDDEE